MARVPHPRGDEGDGVEDDVFDPEEIPEDQMAGLAQSGVGMLRPQSFDEYIGQRDLVEKFRVFIEAAKQRNEALDHVLLHGPPGLGKTTMAQVVANEMGVPFQITSGPAIEHKGHLIGLLTGLKERSVLFIDEVHRLSPTVEEFLYSAMEDGEIDMPLGEGTSAQTVRFQIVPFTLIGATTRTGLLSAPLRDRFHIIESLSLYQNEDLATIVENAASRLGLPCTGPGALEIGRRSRGTPRWAIRLVRRVRDFAQVEGLDRIEPEAAGRFLVKLGVDEEGLTGLDRDLLTAIYDHFAGGPVGVDALAASVGIPRDTIEDVHEPFLLQRGFLLRTSRGRIATKLAARHLGRLVTDG
jgi:holliday junction DNA helicase RuvB